jgi:HD-GYP domain-containing protein (c-di-GMP phosphodiesterase class II)
MVDYEISPEEELAAEIELSETVADQTPATDDKRQVDGKRHALTVYAQTIYYMRSLLTGLSGEGTPISLNKAGRYIQDLVDIYCDQPADFLSLTVLKNDDEYWCFHSVNVAVLAIAIGAQFGLNKAALRDLGTVALLHDIGKIDLNSELLLKNSRLNPDESEQLRKAPLFSVIRFLRTRQINRTTIQGVFTAIEHNARFRASVKDLRGNTSFVIERTDLGVFSKIIAIANTYDALTSRRPFRKAYSPDVAVALMWSELYNKFDPLYLRVFMNVMNSPPVRVPPKPNEKIVSL